MLIAQAAGFVASSIVGRVAEQGIANTLGLATMRHGTNIINWISIHTFGTIPSFGGNRTGGDWKKGYAQSIGRTFFNYAHSTDTEAKGYLGEEKLNPDWYTRSLPKEYEFKSNVNLLSALCIPKLISYPVSLAISAIVPTVKVHLPDDKIKPRPDTLYDKHADFLRDRTEYYSYSTKKWVSPLNFGVIGSIWNSLTYKTPTRIANNGPRVLTGLIQLGVSAAAVAAAMNVAPAFVAAHKTSLIAGLVLGMI